MTKYVLYHKKQLAFWLLMILAIPELFSATGTGSTGNWNQASTWLFGGINRIPACGDTLIIPTSSIITVNSQEDYSVCSQPIIIQIDGVLEFANGNKITLPCSSSVTLLPNGKVRKAGTGGGNSSYIHICNCVAWQASQGQVMGPGNLNCSVLPVTLLSFTVNHKDDYVRLNWSTATEINNDHFSVERASSDLNFYSIGFVKGSGNSNNMIEYSFDDRDELTGIQYYRLRQVDYDGTSVFSDVVALKIIEQKSFSLNPVISEDRSATFIYSNIPGDILLSIYKLNGQLVYTTQLSYTRNLTYRIPEILDQGEYVAYSVSRDVELKTRFRIH